MIYDQAPPRCRPGEINGNVKLLGEVRLDNRNYRKMAFRTLLICQNRRCRVIGGNNFLRNGVILYAQAEFEDYLGDVGLYIIRVVFEG
jgi:hypothetical protein